MLHQVVVTFGFNSRGSKPVGCTLWLKASQTHLSSVGTPHDIYQKIRHVWDVEQTCPYHKWHKTFGSSTLN
ncbi:hypothetical protein PRUPE_6G221300 [Prunus persica]|uniref:Uncharacterized protein n=1 Tax=Prunus persica TaxID=3760 RepID=A0A251NWJ7_PRUPE|nr:hypothetical protein PRUPE_6G221300 [Prunus persica]